MTLKTCIVIPARYDSKRFPGKPLNAVIGGRTLIERVWRIASSVRGVSGVYVATDDGRIADHVRGFGGVAVMTPSDVPSGTDRVQAALAGIGGDIEAVINLQGDAPLTPPWVVQALADEIARDDGPPIATPAVELTQEQLEALEAAKQTAPSSGTTVVVDASGHALYFSKHILPFRRDAYPAPVLRHIGLYAYRRDALDRLVALAPTMLEKAEGLEQLAGPGVRHSHQNRESRLPRPHAPFHRSPERRRHRRSHPEGRRRIRIGRRAVKLYLARHGNTFEDHELPRIVGRNEDMPLTARGEAQAEALGRFFSGMAVRPARIVCGSLQRTRRTAEIAASRFGGLPPAVDWRLMELDYGGWSGLTNAEIDARFGEAERLAWERDSEMPPDRCWSPARPALDAAIAAFASDMQATNGDVLAVTSNGVLRFFACLVPGLFEDLAARGSLKVGTGCVCCLALDEKGASLEFWNRRPDPDQPANGR